MDAPHPPPPSRFACHLPLAGEDELDSMLGKENHMGYTPRRPSAPPSWCGGARSGLKPRAAGAKSSGSAEASRHHQQPALARRPVVLGQPRQGPPQCRPPQRRVHAGTDSPAPRVRTTGRAGRDPSSSPTEGDVCLPFPFAPLFPREGGGPGLTPLSIGCARHETRAWASACAGERCAHAFPFRRLGLDPESVQALRGAQA